MTSSGGVRSPIAPIRVIRTVSVAILLTPVVLGVVVFLAVPSSEYPPPVLPLVLGAVAIGGVLLAETAGYAAPPIQPGTYWQRAAATALQHYRTRWLIRALSTELVLIVGLLLSFMLATPWPYVVAFVLGWPIMVFEVWPSRRTIDRLNLRLERDGAQSHLDDALRGSTGTATGTSTGTA